MKGLLTPGEYAALTGGEHTAPNTQRVPKSRLRKKLEVFVDKELAVPAEALPEIVNTHVNSINKDVNGPTIRIFPETARFFNFRCGRRDLDPGLELGRLQS